MTTTVTTIAPQRDTRLDMTPDEVNYLVVIDDLLTDRTAQAHTIDDLCRDLAVTRRALSDVRWALDIIGQAHTNGDAPDVITEYTDRALLTIERALGSTITRPHTRPL